MLNKAIHAALYSKDIQLEFCSAAKGWAECVEIGNIVAYQKKFEDTTKFFEPGKVIFQIFLTFSFLLYNTWIDYGIYFVCIIDLRNVKRLEVRL